MSNPTKIVVSGDDDLPIVIFSIPNSNALDTLNFVMRLIDLIGLEQLAQREGRSFNHPFADSLGAFPVDVARNLGVQSNQSTASTEFSTGADQLSESITKTFEQDAIGKAFSVGGIPLPPLSIDEMGELNPSATDGEYAAALAEVGETTPLLHRIEAACVTLGCGAKQTGYRTLRALMHPSIDLEPPPCNREAAAVIFLTIAGLLKDAPPEAIARISRAINERSFSSAGLL